jgi:hypothetical protein
MLLITGSIDICTLKPFLIVMKVWPLKMKFRPWNEGQAHNALLTFMRWVTTIFMKMSFIVSSHDE